MTAFIGSFFAIQTAALLLFPLTWTNPLWRLLGATEPQLPMNIILPLLARFVLWVSGVDVQVDDQATRIQSTKIIYMYNHCSNLDPIIVQTVAPCKFVYKKELQRIPIFGWVLYLYRNVSIDRKKRDKAIESLNRAVKRVVGKQQSIAISPEGTRSTTGALQEFKKGPFHLAIQAKANIVPVVIVGAHQLLPPKSALLQGGRVTVKLLPPIHVAGDENIDDLMKRVRKCFEDELAAPQESRSGPRSVMPSIVFVALLLGSVCYLLERR